MEDRDDMLMDHVNTNSRPGDLKITDIRVADIVGAPMHCTLVKVYTNQGLVGYGEVRDGGSRNYVLALKSRLIGENPCNIDKLFRRIKQFGGPARQGGGVCGIELALWDLAGKAYGVPVYQMLGGNSGTASECTAIRISRENIPARKWGKPLKRGWRRDLLS